MIMNVKVAFNFIKQKLTKAGVDDPAFDTIYLFEHILSLSRSSIITNGEKEVCKKDLEALIACADRRIKGEPIQYIIGYWDFMGNRYKVGRDVLIPRDDTEVLVRACTDLLKDKSNAKIVDLCSGSGIIAITLKKMFSASDVFAVEKSDVAYNHLSTNSKDNDADVKCIHADLYDCVTDFSDGIFDLVVSNPPYIITSEIDTLQREVQFEPRLALDGGQDGYDFYRGIINTWSKKLKLGGYIAFEIGEGQFEYISLLLQAHGFSDIKGYLDLGGTTRAITAVYNS